MKKEPSPDSCKSGTSKRDWICFVAGTSGGHILPCLTIANRDYRPNNILFFSSRTSLDTKIISANDHITKHIPLSLGGYRSTNLLGKIFFTLWHGSTSFFISLFYLLMHRPKKVITTGGIVALPVCFAAFLLRIPIELFELNAIPGKAIRLLAPLATQISICFKKTNEHFNTSCTYKAYPIKYTDHHRRLSKTQATQNLDFSTHKKTILILGGSQGSIFINKTIQRFIQKHPVEAKKFQYIHQTGSHDITDWNAFYTKHGLDAHVFAFEADLSLYYRAADLVLCRAGAGTLFETQYFSAPTIIIPLPRHVSDHQIYNAQAFVQESPKTYTMFAQETIQKDYESLFKILLTQNCTISKQQKQYNEKQ